jgi:hypothetical protein
LLIPALSALALFAGHGEACPYDAAADEAGPTAALQVEAAAAEHPAHGADLLGANCPFATALMARKVMEEGRDWTWQGQLGISMARSSNRVAAPYEARDGRLRAWLVATEALETLIAAGHESSTLELQGRLLTTDGVSYAVITSFKALDQ